MAEKQEMRGFCKNFTFAAHSKRALFGIGEHYDYTYMFPSYWSERVESSRLAGVEF